MMRSKIRRLQKLVLLGGASSLFLFYNSSVSPITNKRYLNLFSENLRESGSRQIIKILSPPSVSPSESVEAKNNREVLTSVMVHYFLQGKEVSRSFPAYDKLDEIASRLVEKNPELKLSQPKIHISVDGRLPAFSLADHVVISLNTLMTCSETQIAFILGHEMAHHALDHHIEGLSLKIVDLMAIGITIALMPRKILTALFMIIFDPYKLIVTNPLMRSEEDQADQAGIEMLMKTEYKKDISEVLRMWDQFEEQNPRPAWYYYFTDHPDLKHRKQRMKKQIEEIVNDSRQ